jgi:hypothetical protein
MKKIAMIPQDTTDISKPKRAGNRDNVLRALGDFLKGVTRYDSADDMNSAPEKVRRATAAKGPPKGGPFRPQ